MKNTHIERFYNMIYLPEDCVFYIMSFFRHKNMKYDPIEILLLSLTSKNFNFVVKKYSSIKELSNKEHARAVEQYYYASMYNMKMIHELESLNMRSIPLYSIISFFVKISENVVMLKYFYDNPFFGVYKDTRIKIRLNKKIVEFLFDVVTNPESSKFLLELRKFFILKITDDDNHHYYDDDDDDDILNMIIGKIIDRDYKHIRVLNWLKNNTYEFNYDHT